MWVSTGRFAMNILNPYDRKGREDACFIDRIAVAILWLLVMTLTILLPVMIYKWYKDATTRKRIAFLIVLTALMLAGHLFDLWINS